MSITILEDLQDENYRKEIQNDLKKFLFIRDGNKINISKFVEKDLSINLELLELALQTIIEDSFKEIYVMGWNNYFEIIEIFSLEQRDEELNFFRRFITAVVKEFSNEVEVLFTVSNYDVL